MCACITAGSGCVCLRATTDYWINAMDRQPFLVVHQAIDSGLIKVIEQNSLPDLEERVQGQPDTEALQTDPLRHRFTLVFDREGYSPDWLRRMKNRRIACLAYHKYPGADWSEEEFRSYAVTLPAGQMAALAVGRTRHLPEQWACGYGRSASSPNGDLRPPLATDYRSPLAPVAVAIPSTDLRTGFARWSQENFFKPVEGYARQHFNLDRRVDYGTEPISDPIAIVNPAHRRLDGQVRSAAGKLTRLLAQFGAMNLEQPIEPKHVEPFLQRKAALQEQIDALQTELLAHKQTRKATPRHITVADLPEEDRFRQVSTRSKHLVDMIKMVAYRSETAMANSETLGHPDEALRLLQALYATEADLLPTLPPEP